MRRVGCVEVDTQGDAFFLRSRELRDAVVAAAGSRSEQRSNRPGANARDYGLHTFVAGRGHEYDRLGTDDPPEGWEYDRPTWREQLAALAEEWSRDPHKHRPEPVWHDLRAQAEGRQARTTEVKA
jgi:hypothetical protein